MADLLPKESKILVALDEVQTMLNEITEVKGYNSSPSIKRGWLQHIFQGRHAAPVKFPVIAYRVESSSPTASQNGTSFIDQITIVIDCAVSVKETKDPVTDLLKLLKDVRRSLVFDPWTTKLTISEIDFLECDFDLPEAGDEYAFFSQKLSFKVVENYA